MSILSRKTLKSVLFLPFILFVLLFSGCSNKQITITHDIDLSEVDYIRMIALPSPPKMKIIDQEDDMNQIIDFINSMEKKTTSQEDVNGWTLSIRTTGTVNHSISLLGSRMNMDGTWYKVDANEVTELNELYDSLDYEETDVYEYK